jgi:hypothetical protein
MSLLAILIVGCMMFMVFGVGGGALLYIKLSKNR